MTTPLTDSLASIDLSDNDAFIQQVPHGWFDALRGADPVHWQPERHGRGFWAVTSHADVVAVSKDWAAFSSQNGASALEDLASDALAARRSMIDTDPPQHGELRDLVSAPFSVRSVHGYEELVQQISQQVVRRALAKERFDLVADVAAAVPIKVLCKLLGVPEHDEGLLITLGDQMIANTDPDLASVLLDGGQSEQYRLLPFRSPAALKMFAYSQRLCEARRRQPQPDLMTALAHGTTGGRPLSPREIDVMFLLLVVAGNETTRQAIALGAQALLDYPGRSPNPHTTFGRGGPHRCLGEHLARLELRAVLRELLPALPRLQPDGTPVRIRSNFVNGLKRFPVRVG